MDKGADEGEKSKKSPGRKSRRSRSANLSGENSMNKSDGKSPGKRADHLLIHL